MTETERIKEERRINDEAELMRRLEEIAMADDDNEINDEEKKEDEEMNKSKMKKMKIDY